MTSRCTEWVGAVSTRKPEHGAVNTKPDKVWRAGCAAEYSATTGNVLTFERVQPGGMHPANSNDS